MFLSREVLDRLIPTSACVLEMWSITHQCYKIRQIQGGAACLHHGDFKNLEDIDFGVHLQTSEEHWGEDENKFTFRAKDIRSDNLLIQAYWPIGHFCVKKHCKSFKGNICSGDGVIMFSFISCSLLTDFEEIHILSIPRVSLQPDTNDCGMIAHTR